MGRKRVKVIRASGGIQISAVSQASGPPLPPVNDSCKVPKEKSALPPYPDGNAEQNANDTEKIQTVALEEGSQPETSITQSRSNPDSKSTTIHEKDKEIPWVAAAEADVDFETQLKELRGRIEAKKEATKKRRVQVWKHPTYKEYARMKRIGVSKNVLKELMKSEDRDFSVLENPDQKIELSSRDEGTLDGSSVQSDSDSNDWEDGDFQVQPRKRREGLNIGMLARVQGQEADEALKVLEDLHHHAINAPEESSGESSDESSVLTSSDEEGSLEEEDSSVRKLKKRQQRQKEYAFVKGSLMFKFERLFMHYQLTALLFATDRLTLPETFSRYFGWTWITLEGPTFIFRKLLLFLRPWVKQITGVVLFDVEKYKDPVDFSVLLALFFCVNYALLYSWVIPDYTDPNGIEKWKNYFIVHWWTRGVPSSLKILFMWISIFLLLAGALWYWYVYTFQSNASLQPGDGGRSYSSKYYDDRYMQPRGPSPSKAYGLAFVSCTYCFFVWVTFFILVLWLRHLFHKSTRVNPEYTAIITIKSFVKYKIRILSLFSLFLLVPVCWRLLGVLLPYWDWNDVDAPVLRRDVNYDIPCYFEAFPPVVDLQTNTTIPIVHCYTVSGITLYTGSAILYVLITVGTVSMFYCIIHETFKALRQSDFYEVFLFADRKYLSLREEVDRWSGLKITMLQAEISLYFFRTWTREKIANFDDAFTWYTGAIQFSCRKLARSVKRCLRIDRNRYDLHPLQWKDVTDKVKQRQRERAKQKKRQIKRAKKKLAERKKRRMKRSQLSLFFDSVWHRCRGGKQVKDTNLDELVDQDDLEKSLPHGKRAVWCRTVANSTSFQVVVMAITIYSILPMVMEATLAQILGVVYVYNTPFFCIVFSTEFVLKYIGWRQQYFKSAFNLLDFTLLILCFFDLLMWYVETSSEGGADLPNLSFLRALRAGRGARLTRLGRVSRMLRLGRTLRYIGTALKAWLLLFLSDTAPTEVIIEKILKTGLPRWRLRRTLPVKFEDMKKAFGNLKHEYTVGFGAFRVDHDLVIAPWDSLLDTCAYSYLLAPFKHWQYAWRLNFLIEPIIIVTMFRLSVRDVSPDVPCILAAVTNLCFNIYSILKRPFIYSREKATDETCRFVNMINFSCGFLQYRGIVNQGTLDLILFVSNGFVLLQCVIWLGFLDRIAEQIRLMIDTMDSAVLDYVFEQCSKKSLVFENIHVGLQFLIQWDEVVRHQRRTVLLGWTSTQPSNLIPLSKKLFLVRWAAVRGLYISKMRTQSNLCILHHVVSNAEVEIARWLIHEYPRLATITDEQRDTPIIVALKECAKVLLQLEQDPENTRLQWRRSRFAELLMSKEVQSLKVSWDVHHFKSFEDIAVQNFGTLVQQLALVMNLKPPAGFQRFSMASRFHPTTTKFLAECTVACRPVLEFGNSELGDVGLKSFIGMMQAAQHPRTTMTIPNNFFLAFPIVVRKIIAPRNRLGQEAGIALAEMLSENQTVATLDISSNNLDDLAGIEISRALKYNTALKVLNMRKNNLRAGAGRAIADMLKRNNTLIELDASHNRMGPVLWWKNKFERVFQDGAGEDLGRAVAINQTLTDLDVSFNEFGPKAGDAFAEAFKFNKSLTRLNLEGNALRRQGARHLSEALGMKNGLASLNLSQNVLGRDFGMGLLHQVRSMRTLTDLDISNNEFGTTIGKALMTAIEQNSSLTRLTSRANNFGPSVARELASVLQWNATLTDIDLAKNRLGVRSFEGGDSTDVGELLGRALAGNSLLTSLNLAGNGFDSSCLMPIMTGLEQNQYIKRLTLNDQEYDDVSTLQLAGAIEKTKRFTHLQIDNCSIGPRAGGVLCLSIVNLRQLQVLNLSGNNLGESVALKLAGLIKNKKMRISTLLLANNDFGSDGCMHVASALAYNAGLTSLDLASNSMDDKAAIELAENLSIKMESGVVVRPCRMKHLNLAHNPIGSSAGVEIIEALSNDVSESLNLEQCNLGPECGEALGKGLRSRTVGWTELFLKSNKIGKDGVNSIFWALRKNRSVTVLDLRNNTIGPVFGTSSDTIAEFGTAVAAAVEMNYMMRWLDLGYNSLSAECGMNFCQAMIENPSLLSIAMEGNDLDYRAGLAVSEKLASDTQLKYINLSKNRIGWQGGQGIAEALFSNRTLTSLNLADNGLGDRGPQVGALFAQMLTLNTSLRDLNLNHNRLGRAAGIGIAEALKKNNSLTRCDLVSNRFDGGVGLFFRQMLEQNQTVLHLSLSVDEIGVDEHDPIRRELKKRVPADEAEENDDTTHQD